MVAALPGMPTELHRALLQAGVRVKDFEPQAAATELRAGRVSLVIVPSAVPGQPLIFRWDSIARRGAQRSRGGERGRATRRRAEGSSASPR